jgi:transposase
MLRAVKTMDKKLTEEELQRYKTEAEMTPYSEPSYRMLRLLSHIEQLKIRIKDLEEQRWEETKRHVVEEIELEKRAGQEEQLYFQCSQDNQKLRIQMSQQAQEIERLEWISDNISTQNLDYREKCASLASKAQHLEEALNKVRTVA